MTDAVDTSAEAVERRAKRMEAAALVYKERAPCCGEGRIGGVCRAPACHFGEVMGGLQGGAATLRALAAERDAAVARAERWDTEAAAARIAIPRIEAERDAAQAEIARLREALEYWLHDEEVRDFGEWFEGGCKIARAALAKETGHG